jgi:addiction module HigA family antidote
MGICNPSHPGEILKHDILPALGLNITEAAKQLGVTRVSLSRFLNGQCGISPEMAIRLEAWCKKPTAEMWVQMQAGYDLWQARHNQKIKKAIRVKPAISIDGFVSA